MSKNLIIGIDAGTSVIKSVAFDLTGRQIAVASVPNRYTTAEDGSATQPLDQTWNDCVPVSYTHLTLPTIYSV